MPSPSEVSASPQVGPLKAFNADSYKVEVIGYIARSVAHNETGKLMPFVIQNAFILLAPALFAASIYMTLGHIIRCVKGESYSTIRVNWLTKTFVLGDVLSFLIQGSASGLIVTGNNLRLGEDIVVVGLFIQVIMFGLFAITAIIFVVWYPSGMRSTALNVASMELTTQYRRR